MNLINEFTAKFALLNSDDQQAFIARINEVLSTNPDFQDSSRFFQSVRSIEFSKSQVLCLNCCSSKVMGYGFTPRRVRRYRCNDCKHVFSETSGTAVSRIRDLKKFNHYIFCMLSGYSLRASASDVGISLQTSFAWRHIILNSLQNVRELTFSNIVEVDETFILHSEVGNKNIKGRKPRKRGGKAKSDGITKAHVSVYVCTDREGKSLLAVGGRGKLTKAAIHRTIGNTISSENTVISDSDRNLAFYLKDRNIKQIKLSARKKERVKDKIFHIQHTNNLQQRLKDWLRKFKGVASKYLQNYLNWFLAIELIKNQPNKHQAFVIQALRRITL
ncbi:MAG: IS1595 family transposase [Bacteroidetes bacterium]|nr:MAG: IS1595 family transposase [Bacteroidota bacterium]